jgi:hypothetical protein
MLPPVALKPSSNASGLPVGLNVRSGATAMFQMRLALAGTAGRESRLPVIVSVGSANAGNAKAHTNAAESKLLQDMRFLLVPRRQQQPTDKTCRKTAAFTITRRNKERSVRAQPP